MNTTTAKAAAQAGVTVRTVQAWCRTGAVAAIKQAGRWIIDTASLAYRISLPTLLRPARKAVTLTADMIVALGGRRWTNPRTNTERVYLTNWASFAGIEIARYGSGNVASAAIGGRGIANSRVSKLLSAVDKVWFDAADGRLYIRHYNANAFEVRYLDGERDTINLVAMLRAGVNTAAAAL